MTRAKYPTAWEPVPAKEIDKRYRPSTRVVICDNYMRIEREQLQQRMLSRCLREVRDEWMDVMIVSMRDAPVERLLEIHRFVTEQLESEAYRVLYEKEGMPR